jgi:hypothetical protein
VLNIAVNWGLKSGGLAPVVALARWIAHSPAAMPEARRIDRLRAWRPRAGGLLSQDESRHLWPAALFENVYAMLPAGTNCAPVRGE